MKLFIVRHGLSIGNINPQVYFEKNDCDIELAPRGKDDAINAADFIYNHIHGIHTRLEYPQDERVFLKMAHSTYMRATQTANIIYDRINSNKGYTVEKIVSSPLCREREWGSLRDILSLRNQREDHFNFYYRPLNGESFADLHQRAAIFHQWLISTCKCDNVIVVAHGEFNKAYIMYLLNWTPEEFSMWSNQKNGEVWIVENGRLNYSTPLRESKHYKKGSIKTEIQ